MMEGVHTITMKLMVAGDTSDLDSPHRWNKEGLEVTPYHTHVMRPARQARFGENDYHKAERGHFLNEAYLYVMGRAMGGRCSCQDSVRFNELGMQFGVVTRDRDPTPIHALAYAKHQDASYFGQPGRTDYEYPFLTMQLDLDKGTLKTWMNEVFMGSTMEGIKGPVKWMASFSRHQYMGAMRIVQNESHVPQCNMQCDAVFM
jgi:hypothetical protein